MADLEPAGATVGQVVVLAGGLARRMGALTERRPKYLLPVAGKPFAAHQLALLARCGLRDVLLCTGHLGEQIEAVIGDGSAYGVQVRYSREEEPRGTAGALRQALPLLQDTFVLTYGDSYLPFDYAAPLRLLQQTPSAAGCMAVYANQGRFDTSNAVVTGDWVSRYDKGSRDPQLCHIDYGATALRRHTIAELAADISDLAPLFSALAARASLLAYPASERFYEIGSPQGYAELDALLSCATMRPPSPIGLP